MDDFENLKDFDVFKDNSGNFMLRPKKKPRNDFEDSPMPNTSNSSTIVGEKENVITIANSENEMETLGANSNEMETSAQVSSTF